MIFGYIEIENFFRIREKVKIQLNNQGLVLITGNNGDGKSTIFESLIWCITGTTVRGYKADQVVNRDVGKDCSVTVVMTDGGLIAYRVTRYRKHKTGKNKLELISLDFNSQVETDLTQQTNDDTQSKLNEIMGIDFDTFTNGPMMPQGSFKRFSEMSDAEIKSVLEKAIQISVISQAQAKAKQKANEVQLKILQVGADFNKHSSTLDSKQSEMMHLQIEHENFDSMTAREISLCVSRLNELKDRLSKLDKEYKVDELKDQLVLAKAAYDKVCEIYNTLQSKWKSDENEADEAFRQAEIQHMMVAKECERLQEAKTRIKSLEGTCPSCEQSIPVSYVEKLFNETDKIFQESNTNLKTNLAPKVHESQKALQQLRVDRDVALEQAKSIWLDSIDKIHDVEHHIEINEGRVRELKQCKSDVIKAEESLDLVKRKVSPFASIIKKNQEDQNEAKRHLTRIIPRLKSLSIEKEQLEFWVDGFSNKGLKSFVLASVVPFLDSKVAEYSRVLTDGELEIRFHTQTTLKSGETREKFYVEVSNKVGAEDYVGSSGGERRRADLAISFTLSDLFSIRSKKSFPQRFFDEPFSELDEAGIEAVMQLLQEMVTRSGSIFVITHQEYMKSMFDKVITVEKIDGETRISQ